MIIAPIGNIQCKMVLCLFCVRFTCFFVWHKTMHGWGCERKRRTPMRWNNVLKVFMHRAQLHTACIVLHSSVRTFTRAYHLSMCTRGSQLGTHRNRRGRESREPIKNFVNLKSNGVATARCCLPPLLLRCAACACRECVDVCLCVCSSLVIPKPLNGSSRNIFVRQMHLGWTLKIHLRG